MAVPVSHLPDVVDEIEAVNIVDVSILIVVDSIVGDFSGIDPLGPLEVWVLKVNSAVDNSYDHFPLSRPLVDFPCLENGNISSRCSTFLTGILQAP